MADVERLTVREAAFLLGVSASTVRRRIATSELRAEREERPQGSRFWVYLPAGTPPPTTPADSPPGMLPAPVAALEAHIESLERTLDGEQRAGSELPQQLGREQAAHQDTRAQLVATEMARDRPLKASPDAPQTPSINVPEARAEAEPPEEVRGALLWLYGLLLAVVVAVAMYLGRLLS